MVNCTTFITTPILFCNEKRNHLQFIRKSVSTFHRYSTIPQCSLDGNFSSLPNQDWKSVRAKLVQSEAKGKLSLTSHTAIDEKTWAHYVPFVERGSLLVANPEHFKGENENSYFANTVVYMLEHDSSSQGGSAGIILNKPASSNRGKIRNNGIDTSEEVHIPLYVGGPVNLQSGLLFHRDDEKDDSISNQIRIFKFQEAFDNMNSAGLGRGRYRLFCGYSGWDAHQLEQEILDGVWYTCSCSEDVVMRDWSCNLELPKLILNLMGGRYKEVARLINGDDMRW